MPGERVHVALRAGTVVLPGVTAIGRTHQSAELDAGQDEIRVVRARCDPADVRSPRAWREAPGRGRRELTECRELLPTTAPAGPERARLAARVRDGVGRAVGDREDVVRGEFGVSPRATSVLTLEHTAATATGQDALWIARVDGNALRAFLLEHSLGSPAVDAEDRVARGDEERRHRAAISAGKRPASKSRTNSSSPCSKEKPRPWACR